MIDTRRRRDLGHHVSPSSSGTRKAHRCVALAQTGSYAPRTPCESVGTLDETETTGKSQLQQAIETSLAAAEGESAPSTVEPAQEPKPHANLRFYLAILGVLPWIGTLISASLQRWSEHEQGKTNAFFRGWLEEHDARFRMLEEVTGRITDAADRAGPAARERLNSEAFLPLARQGFRVWDRSETPDKRELIRRVLTNAACDSMSTDDFVRRFIEWIDQYNELHFRIVRTLFDAPGSTRAEIWDELHGVEVREDSAEADLFKLLIRDLSTGSVIRQHRETDLAGRFLRKKPTRRKTSGVLKSAFDGKEKYVLTELGEHFVHYALNDDIPKLGAGTNDGDA